MQVNNLKEKKLSANNIKCILVNLRGGTRNAGSLGCANVFEPLGLLYLSAYIKNIDGVQCNVIHQIDQSHDEIIQQIRDERPNIVGFSTPVFVKQVVA